MAGILGPVQTSDVTAPVCPGASVEHCLGASWATRDSPRTEVKALLVFAGPRVRLTVVRGPAGNQRGCDAKAGGSG